MLWSLIPEKKVEEFFGQFSDRRILKNCVPLSRRDIY
jgi:hypothetical protein